MSGFFQCYYYRSDNQEDVYNILMHSKQHGYIFSPYNGWIQFVAEGQPLKLNNSIIQSNTGLLIHMIYAEDHGWEFDVFNQTHLISEYSCVWNDVVKYTVDDSFDWIFSELGVNIDPIRHLLFPSKHDLQLIYDSDPAEAFCDLLGLKSIDGISFYYLDQHLNLYLQTDPDILAV